jgi:hypothetical protein
MTSRLATPPGQILIENDRNGFHLPTEVAKSWKTLEQTCRQIYFVLHSSYCQERPGVLIPSAPAKPSDFGYFRSHLSEEKARSAISESLDAFVILFAYVSFCIAICRAQGDPASVSLSTSKSKPRWLQLLSDKDSMLHPESVRLLADSPIADFTSGTQRLGAIINVSCCSWMHLVPYMMRANVPIWLYWGVPPAFFRPLDDGALFFAPRSHPQSKAPRALPPSQPAGPSVPPTHETWNEFLSRQNKWRKARLEKENDQQRKVRKGRELSAANKKCPGKKGPHVFIWEEDNGVWTRTLLTRGQVEGYWNRPSQKIFNPFDNYWDICFQIGTAGEFDDEYDPNDSDSDYYGPPHPQKQSQRSPTPKIRRSSDASDFPPITVDRTPVPVLMSAQVASDPLSTVVGPSLPVSSPAQVASVLMPAQVASDPLSTIVGPTLPVSSPAQVASDPLPMAVDSVVDTTPPSVSLPGQVASDPLPMAVDFTPLPASSPAQVASDPLPTVVETTPISVSLPDQVASDLLPMAVDSTPLPVSSPGQVTSDLLPMAVDLTPLPVSSPAQVATHKDDEDPYVASREDVLNAYSFVPLDLELMPITTLDDLLYFRYGFSLNEKLYKGIPSSYKAGTLTFRSWTEVCRAVGGQELESLALNHRPIQDFLSILAGCSNPLKDVPGKYWDLSPLGKKPIADLSEVYISIEEMQFTTGTQYFISPLSRFLHTEPDTTPWFLSVDSMTALECIRRGLGPHTIDIANFFIAHGVRFRTFQRIQNSPDSFEIPPVPPQCRYIGYRSLDYSFDLADFAGYEVLRDSFLRSQPHGPLALREGGVIARLAREVLPNSDALSGPSSKALGGHRARFFYDDKPEIYVEDEFSEAELRLICGTYALADTSDNGMRIFLN